MREVTQQEKLMSIGISMLALGIFPLIWFLVKSSIMLREVGFPLSQLFIYPFQYFERFIESIKSGKNDQPDFKRGSEIQKILDACIKSSDENVWIDI